MLLSAFIRDGAARLEKLYPSPEARGLVLMLCRERLGVTNYTHIVEPERTVPDEQLPELEEDLRRLCAGEPIQYVLGYAEFCDRRFAVGLGVLIPRPETEQLVAEAVRALRAMELERPARVLDLCTGSGCIAWTLALDLPGTEVIGIDLSEDALRFARKQFTSSFAGSPTFLQSDILDTEQPFEGGPFDLIVSNPPYVCERARAQMRPNVLDWEPGLALFVPDDDPLRFYRAIARWAQRFLRPGGVGLVEINQDLGPETAALFRDAGLKNIQILPDFRKNIRFVRFSSPCGGSPAKP